MGGVQYLRHLVQIVAFAAINAKLFGFVGTQIIVPYVYPAQAPFATVAGAFESLEFTIARGVFPLLVLGVILLTGITVGRVFCGWACPMGLLQDVLIYVPVKKDVNWYNVVAWVKDLRWGVVAFSLIMAVLVGWRRGAEGEAPLGFFSDAPFQVLSPAGTLFAYLPWMVLWKSNVLLSAGVWGWLKLVLLIAVLVPSVYIPRFFCRYICPMGAVLQPMAPFKFLRIRRAPGVSKEECNRILDDVCPMGVKVGDSDSFVSDPNCIHCGNCPTAAPDVFSQQI